MSKATNCNTNLSAQQVLEWMATEEYKEKNFAREALVINAAKACQPYGAMLCALGIEGCLPFLHGSQGCAAYFRSALTRHVREPGGYGFGFYDRRCGCLRGAG